MVAQIYQNRPICQQLRFAYIENRHFVVRV